MVDAASLLFMASGVSSYPVIFHLSLRKSLSIVSREKVANGRVLLSLIILYLEAVALVMLSTPLSFIPPSFLASLIALSAIVLLASYTLKALFGLSFRRSIIAFALWQVLCLALGGLLVVTIIAAMLETVFAFTLIVALMLAGWWMWGGEFGLSAGCDNLRLGRLDKRAVAIAMIALLYSSMVVPSAVVRCAPEEREVDIDFTWENNGLVHKVGVNLTWNATVANDTAQSTVGQANGAVEFSTGIGQGIADIVGGIVNVPAALYSLHDFKEATTYLSLINDVTQLQRIMEPQKPLLPPNSPFDIQAGKESASPFAKDGALAERLSDMSRKEYKVEVARNPDYISRAVDIEKYVDGVAWDSALTNYFTLNFPLAYETYQKMRDETGNEGEALWQAARIFGLTSPYLEAKEAVDSGDPNRIGRSGIKAAISFASTLFMLRSAQRMARGEGVIETVTKTAFDYVMPGQTLYYILKAGVLKARGAIAAIKDMGLREALTSTLDDLTSRFRSDENIESQMLDEDVTDVRTYDKAMLDGGGIEETPQASIPKENIWKWVLEDASVAKKVSSESWVRSFIKEVDDYQKLDQISEGETEILGLKIDLEKGIVQRGYPDSIGKSYFDMELLDTGSKIRVYEDNSVSVWYGKGFKRLRMEQLEEVGAYIEPLETDGGTRPDGRVNPGTDLTSILTSNHLEKIGFYDEFVIGQETERAFGVKGTVKANRESNDGPYVEIEYKADKGSGSGIKEVRISSKGVTVNGLPVVDVEIGEDGSVYLHYKEVDEVRRTIIKLPDTLVTTVNQARLIEANDLTNGFNYNDIQGKTGAGDLLEELDIKSSKDYTRKVAYAVDGKTIGDFKAKYGIDKWEEFTKLADDFSKSAAEEALWNMGLDVEEVKVIHGVRPEGGVDILITTKEGKVLKLDIEYAGQKSFSDQRSNMAEKFAKNKADLGIIFWEGEYHVSINSATGYEPLANIARDIERAGSRCIKDFAGIAAIGGLGLLSGYFSDAKGEAVSVTDDAGRWLGEFQDSHLDHTAVDESTVSGSWLALTSVERSYLQNVRGAGTTIAGSTVTNCNVSAKMIYDSIVQNALAVCSTIANSVIDLCRILNSTLVNVIDLDRSHIEDTTITNSADISNCTMIDSNLMSVINLVNASITGSNLTLVANVDNTKINHSDISYSANISRSEIANTMLRGCTVQGSRLTSCTATDSILRIVNATSSKLTKANVENSNLKGVELRNTSVFGTDLANMALVDRTVMYGRSIYAGETGALRNLTASKVGTPIYSGKGTGSGASTSNTSGVKRSSSTSSPSKTQAVASDETGALRSLLVKGTSSTSSVVQTSSQQVQRAIEAAPSGVMPAEARRLLR